MIPLQDPEAIQRVRDYWNARPCNIRHSPRPKGTKEYFDEVETRKYLVEPHIPRFADFPRWRGKRVLEIGCGIGTDTVNFARSGAQVTAVELSEKSMELARRRAEVFGLSGRIRFVCADVETLDSRLDPEDKFDLVYSFGVLHHTPDPGKAVRQLRRFTRPDGEIRIMVYHRRSYKVLWILLAYGRGRFWRASDLVPRYSEAQTGCPVTYTYTRAGGKGLLEQAGFRVTRAEVDHIFPYRIDDYVNYRYVRQWQFRWMPDRLFRFLEKRFGWHLCLTAVPEPEAAAPGP